MLKNEIGRTKCHEKYKKTPPDITQPLDCLAALLLEALRCHEKYPPPEITQPLNSLASNSPQDYRISGFC